METIVKKLLTIDRHGQQYTLEFHSIKPFPRSFSVQAFASKLGHYKWQGKPIDAPTSNGVFYLAEIDTNVIQVFPH